MGGEKIERITVDMNADRLPADLERYKAKAIELGASRATIVKVNEIPVDDRVVLKCQIPRCFGYGTSAHCPPNTMKPAELREILKGYEWAVFFALDVSPEVIVRDRHTIKERESAYQKIFNIVNQIESMAFYDGHYLAFGFAAGSCRHTFCSQQESCQALEGKRCRISLRSRPSMEAVGIDVYKMATSIGWDIYPIGSNAKPENICKGTLAGIVIVQ
jgi:predicted metal-binding protein